MARRKGEKAVREKNDNYPTPPRLAEAIVLRLREMYGDVSASHVLIEPSAGSGTFVRYMRQAWPTSTLIAVELRIEEEENLRQSGATYVAIADWSQWTVEHPPARWIIPNVANNTPSLIIGNPPFTLAQKHLESIFQAFPEGSEVAYLLRFSFFGGRERTVQFWQAQGMQFLKHIIPIAPRPQFVRGTSDNSEYAVFIWKIGHSEPATILPSILWEKREPRLVAVND